MTPKTKRPARPRSARSIRQSQVTATQTVVQTPNSTQTVVIINQAQSLHIVQTTVSAALSAILWINDLFPNHYFETRRYSLDDPAFSYTLKHPPQTARDKKQQANDAASVTWDFLLKGKTAKADKIWLWLDGVYDALKHKYLASFQISFHNGDVSPNTVAVAYVMKFNYAEDEGDIQLNISSENKTVAITAKDMQDLKNMFDRLVKWSQKTGKCPERPTISLLMTYNETCPIEYQPKGFVVALDASVLENQNGLNIGEVDTRYHSVGMSLITAGLLQTNSQQTNQNNLVSTQATSPSDGSSVLNTQERADRQLIREMVLVRREAGDTQRVHDTQSQRSAVEGSPSPKVQHGSVEEESILPPEERRFYFDSEALQEIYPNRKWRNEQIQISFTEGGDTDCYCTKKFAGMTVQCEICQRRQHLQCYGYLETDVVDIYMCYKCLLPSEPDLRKEMQQLCSLRQVAWIASMERYPLKEADLAERIGCRVKDVTSLSQRLAQENYLRKNSRPQNKKHKNYNKRFKIPLYEFRMEERGRMLKEYLNPTYKIKAYLHQHPQASVDKPQPEQPSSPTLPLPRMSSMPPESVRLVPNTPPLATPEPKHSNLIGAGPLLGIWYTDDEDTTSHPGTTDESSMDCTTQGTSSHIGSPGPRPPLDLKRKTDVLEGERRVRRKPACVNSPFVLRRGQYE